MHYVLRSLVSCNRNYWAPHCITVYHCALLGTTLHHSPLVSTTLHYSALQGPLGATGHHWALLGTTESTGRHWALLGTTEHDRDHRATLATTGHDRDHWAPQSTTLHQTASHALCHATNQTRLAMPRITRHMPCHASRATCQLH